MKYATRLIDPEYRSYFFLKIIRKNFESALKRDNGIDIAVHSVGDIVHSHSLFDACNLYTFTHELSSVPIRRYDLSLTDLGLRTSQRADHLPRLPRG